jgi:hypothetical protein
LRLVLRGLLLLLHSKALSVPLRHIAHVMLLLRHLELRLLLISSFRGFFAVSKRAVISEPALSFGFPISAHDCFIVIVLLLLGLVLLVRLLLMRLVLLRGLLMTHLSLEFWRQGIIYVSEFLLTVSKMTPIAQVTSLSLFEVSAQLSLKPKVWLCLVLVGLHVLFGLLVHLLLGHTVHHRVVLLLLLLLLSNSIYLHFRFI